MDEMVSIQWIDSATHDGWRKNETVYELSKCKTIGFLVEETDGMVAIAQSIDTGEDCWTYCSVISIPKVCITSRSSLIFDIKDDK